MRTDNASMPQTSSSNGPKRNKSETKKAAKPKRHRKILARSESKKRKTKALQIRKLDEFSDEAKAAVEVGRKMVAAVERSLWDIADHAVILHTAHGMTYREIEVFLGTHSFSRYCVLSKISREFPKRDRPDGFTVSHAEATLGAESLKGLNLKRTEIMETIQKKNMSARRIRKHFLGDRQKKAVRHVAKSVKKLISTEGTALEGRALRGDYRERTGDVADGSVATIMTDPPFSQYDRLDDGHYHSGRSGSGLREECSFDTREKAREVTEALFPLAARVLRPGGTLLIFQPGLKVPQRWLLDSAKDNGLICHYMLTWTKMLSQPTDFDHAYTYSSERVLVFARPDEVPRDHSDGKISRSEILTGHPSPTQHFYSQIQSGANAPGDVHKYQKPISLLEDLVRKHSYENELVLDVFGCSAATSIACIKHNRIWRYFEHDPSNFEFGVSRIKKALDGEFDQLG